MPGKRGPAESAQRPGWALGERRAMPKVDRMNKTGLLRAIVETLEAELDAAVREARAASDAATDPDSKAENKYDTRALEASYLARGQARRVTELQESLRDLLAFAAAPPPTGGPAALGSLVTLETPDGPLAYFLCPAAGGAEVPHEGRTITLLTPASPLGRKLAGRRAGDTVAAHPGRPAWRVLAVE